jgi:glutathione S-transferase
MSVPVLWHIPFANFSEKARWALDYKGLAHRRVPAPFPLAHVPIAWALTRRSGTFPVLRIDGRAIGDSSEIVAELEQRYPDPPLYPADPAARRRALELEAFFDKELGHDVRRVAFCEIFREPELLEPPPGRIAGALTVARPAMIALARRRYAIPVDDASGPLLKVQAVLRLIEAELAGGEHLAGDRFSVADLTAAALLGPLLMPQQFPYPLPARPPSLDRIAGELRALPGGAWVVRTYERYRGSSAEIPSGTSPGGAESSTARSSSRPGSARSSRRSRTAAPP